MTDQPSPAAVWNAFDRICSYIMAFHLREVKAFYDRTGTYPDP